VKRALKLRWAAAVILCAVLLGLAALPVEAVIPSPKTASYVNDYGNLLDAKTQAELSEIGEALEKKNRCGSGPGDGGKPGWYAD